MLLFIIIINDNNNDIKKNYLIMKTKFFINIIYLLFNN